MGMEFDLEYFAEIVKKGGIGAFPTETVYGLGGHSLLENSLERIYAIKGREKAFPLALHISSLSELYKFARDVPKEANLLIYEFWPGPLALILPASPLVPSYALSEKGTVSFRYPDCSKFLSFARLVGAPIAGTSANRSGSLSPIFPGDVKGELGDSLEFIIDGGVTKHKLESSIVDLTQRPFLLLREGVIKKEELENRTGMEFQFSGNRIKHQNLILFEEGGMDPSKLENFLQGEETVILSFSPLDLPHIQLKKDTGEGQLFRLLGELQKQGKSLVLLENIWNEEDRIFQRLKVRTLKIVKKNKREEI
ncbi:MAG: L-threonylcarbamoyladenylate synthase [Caldiserica bacterium]|jgi:tRNA threonylcarbamoyl adenosine modification protein (Sua5/YciO/YrdC/YwlC family)|nr:L-threonylcarbamoyladenylate synthase [Caldisericota bacterium]MDH7562772.1 L-threonylcarbamoyladenylate synthase [Caldisericota bacterium]